MIQVTYLVEYAPEEFAILRFGRWVDGKCVGRRDLVLVMCRGLAPTSITEQANSR